MIFLCAYAAATAFPAYKNKVELQCGPPSCKAPFVRVEAGNRTGRFEVTPLGDVVQAARWACQQLVDVTSAERDCVRLMWRQYAEQALAYVVADENDRHAKARTNVWFEVNALYWPALFYDHVAFDEKLNIIEVGSFEGGSSTFFQRSALSHPQSTLTCIDTWAGSHSSTLESKEGAIYKGFTLDDHEARFARFQANTRSNPYPEKVRVIRSDSFNGLAVLLGEQEQDRHKRYDLVYLDGSHHSADVLAELVLCFHLVRVGALIILDDYKWGSNFGVADRPKTAVDAFLVSFASQVEVVHSGYQFAFKKTGERFNMPPRSDFYFKSERASDAAQTQAEQMWM